MIGWMKSHYRRQMFLPGWLGVIVNPFYLARHGLAKAMSELAPKISGRLLDVGCGTKPYQGFFGVESYVGLDIESESSCRRGTADYLYDGNNFPLSDASFDAVLCNQVLEHVFNPDVFLGEINRVLKPGGKFLLTVPFVWDEHEQPFDFARYSSFGLRALLEEAGFKVLEHKKLGADASIIFQLINAYLFKISQGWVRPFKLFFTFSVMAMFNILGLVASWSLPGNPDLYLDHVLLAEKAN